MFDTAAKKSTGMRALTLSENDDVCVKSTERWNSENILEQPTILTRYAKHITMKSMFYNTEQSLKLTSSFKFYEADIEMEWEKRQQIINSTNKIHSNLPI